MAIRPNRSYNDPALGQAFSNIAQMFAPPGGADLAGYATARAKGEEADRLGALYSYAQGPNFDQSTFDRMGQAAGQWNPSNGYYGVDTAATTARRGQDVTAATTLEQQRIQNAGALELQNAAPVILNTGQVAHLPGQTQAATGFGGQLYGNIEAAPGEMITTPDGRVIAGTPKPLTLPEQEAAERQALISRGLLTDDMLIEGIMGERAPVQAVGPEGSPVYMTPGAAARTGAAPYNAPAAGSVKTSNYQTPEGRRGTARIENGRLFDSTTGAELPQGTVTFGTNIQGGADDVGLGGTKTNVTDWNKQAYEADYALQRVDTFENLLKTNPGVLGIAGTVQGFVQNAQQGARELSNLYGDNTMVRDISELSSMMAETAKVNGWNPAVAQANILALEMAYMEIKSQDPSGEVNVRELERVLPLFTGGLAGNQPVLDVLQVTRQRLQHRGNAARAALGREQGNTPAQDLSGITQNAPAAAPQPGHEEEGFRFKGGDPADPNSWERI